MSKGWGLLARWVGLPAWGGGVLAGLLALIHYQMSPAAVEHVAPAQWPSATHLTRDARYPTLVMFLHPQCPCSRASLDELEQAIARGGGQLCSELVFVQPTDAPANWLDGDLWRHAHSIPGVSVIVDPDGKLAAAFGADTSGQVVLYDTTGKLLFAGGITDGRGHDGDSAGLYAVVSVLHHQTPLITRTPVYGCSLDGCKRIYPTTGNSP